MGIAVLFSAQGGVLPSIRPLKGVDKKNFRENAAQDAMLVSHYPEGPLACDRILEYDVTTSTDTFPCWTSCL